MNKQKYIHMDEGVQGEMIYLHEIISSNLREKLSYQSKHPLNYL